MPVQISGVQLGNLLGPPTAISLNDLSDVNIIAPENNQILRFNVGDQEWINDDLSSTLISTDGVTIDIVSGLTEIGLGDITPDSVVSTGLIVGSNISGINTGDQTIALTGDVTGTGTGSFSATLATVNAAPQTDTFRKITVNGKGLVTATSAVTAADITPLVNATYVLKAGDTMTGSLLLNADPIQALGAVTKQYVDNVAAGLAAHPSVITGTTATLATSSAGTVIYANGTAGVGATLTTTGSFNNIGGATTVNGNRILVKNEVATANNGIYVRTSATVLTRAADFDDSPDGEIDSGAFTFISTGTLAGTNWVLTTPAPITVGTTGLVFSQLSGAGTYVAGTGISVTSNSISNTGVLSVAGTTNQITASAATGAVTLSLPSAVTISGAMTAGSFVGPVTGASSLNVLKSGDTMTGNLTMTAAEPITLQNPSAAITWRNPPNEEPPGLLIGRAPSNVLIVRGNNGVSIETSNTAVQLFGSVFQPQVASGISLGTGSVPWNQGFFSGNVGIGSANPTVKLQIEDPKQARIILRSTTASFDDGGSIFFQRLNVMSGSVGSQANRIGDSSDHLLIQSDNDINFISQPVFNGIAPSVTIKKTSGNLGIGTVTPTAKLTFGIQDIIGEIGRIGFDVDQSQYAYIAANRHTAVGRLTDMSFGTMSTERMRISSAGTVNVGPISSATFDATNRTVLNVNGTLESVIGFGNQSGPTAYMFANPSFLSINHAANGYMTFGTSGIERMRINAGGAVGIGIDPLVQLDVQAPGQTVARFNSTSTVGAFISIGNGGTSGRGFVGSGLNVLPGMGPVDFGIVSEGGGLFLGSNNQERINIDAAGYVSIGHAGVLKPTLLVGGTGISSAFGATGDVAIDTIRTGTATGGGLLIIRGYSGGNGVSFCRIYAYFNDVSGGNQTSGMSIISSVGDANATFTMSRSGTQLRITGASLFGGSWYCSFIGM